MYRLVASDMDETFLAHDHSIPQANIEAIRRMRELGVLFVPASGGRTRRWSRASRPFLQTFSTAPT